MDTIPFQEAFQKAMKKAYDQIQEAQEKLTERQFVDLCRQLFASGDIMRNVRMSDGAQSLTYMPYSECESLRAQLEAEQELHRMQLAGIMTASIQNTESTVKYRIDRDNPYWTQAYADVCQTVDREMRERARAEKAERERDEARLKADNAAGMRAAELAENERLRAEIDEARAALRKICEDATTADHPTDALVPGSRIDHARAILAQTQPQPAPKGEGHAEFYWIPTVECNGSFASACSTPENRHVTRNIHEALKFTSISGCRAWCSLANETAKAGYIPTQHGFHVKDEAGADDALAALRQCVEALDTAACKIRPYTGDWLKMRAALAAANAVLKGGKA